MRCRQAFLIITDVVINGDKLIAGVKESMKIRDKS